MSTPIEDLSKAAKTFQKSVKKQLKNPKKLFIAVFPYVMFAYFANKIGMAWRITDNANVFQRLIGCLSNLNVAFATLFPSFVPFDIVFGIIGGIAFRVIVYFKSKNRKKWRQGEEYGSAPNFANSYNLIPFGSRIRFSYQNLVNNIFSKLSLAIHLNYCGMTSDNFSEEVCLKNYVSYARKTYNKCSSLAVAVSLPYRLFNYSQLFDTEVFDESWDITDESAIFSEDNLRELAEQINIPRDDDRTKKLYQWEHLRWNRYATFNEAWITTSPAQVEKYITAGNHRQQLFSAKVHPCIIKWSELDDLSQKISQMLRNNGVDLKKDKNFKKSDEDSILLTKEILEEAVLKKSAALQRLFL